VNDGLAMRISTFLVGLNGDRLSPKGHGAFSEMPGERAPSFRDLSVGEAPAPLPQEGENGGGGKFPSRISHRKDQPGSPGMEEKAPRS